MVVVARGVVGRADRPEDEPDGVVAISGAVVVAVPARGRAEPAIVLGVVHPARVADAIDRDRVGSNLKVGQVEELERPEVGLGQRSFAVREPQLVIDGLDDVVRTDRDPRVGRLEAGLILVESLPRAE